MKIVTYRVRIEPGTDCGYIASFPALPGCHTQGNSIEEALINAEDALGVYVASLLADGEPVPGEPIKAASFEMSLSAVVPSR